ncbi:MAG: hypothetical protein K8T20_00630 [Planctomycetes bacterium]|nr:hypothetical protein [Planctomycetota bacterium]
MPNVKRAPFRSGVRWYSLWDQNGQRVGYERHVVSAVSDGSATIETLTSYKAAGGMSESVATLAFGTGGARLEAVRYQRDGVMGFQIRRNGEVFSGTWAGKPFTRILPADFIPNFGNAEWVATLPLESQSLVAFSRLPMGADIPASAGVECVGEEDQQVGGKLIKAWHFVERVGGKDRNRWWVDSDRTVVRVNFGLNAVLESSESGAKGAPVARDRQTMGAGGIAAFDDPTKVMGATGRQSTQISGPGTRPPGVPGAPGSGVRGTTPGVVDSPSQIMGRATAPPPPGANSAVVPPSGEPARRPELVIPAAGPAPTRELGERGVYRKGKYWYSLWNNGAPAGWESQLVNTTGEGAMLETETHYLGQDNTWHKTSAVVVFGAQDKIANAHFMQDGIQTELGQPFFTLRHIETGFIGTWQGKPYKRALPDDFVPGFGLSQWIATFSQSPGSRRIVQRLARTATELAPCGIECHGEQEVEIRGQKVVLCKFVERINDRARSMWWVDRDRVVRKHYFGLDAILEDDEAAAKAAGTPKPAG